MGPRYEPPCLAHRVALTSLLAVAGGCSLTSFVDLEIKTCESGSSALACNEQVCKALNQREGIDVRTACELYQYAQGGGCVLAARDWDGDGFVAATCVSSHAAADCDDEDGAVHPGAEETCDGRDEDCSGVIDDGVFVAQTPASTVAGAAAQLASEVRYAADGSPYALLMSAADPGMLPSRVDLSKAATAPVEPKFYAGSLLTLPVEDELRSACSAESGEASVSCAFAAGALAGADAAQLAAFVDVRGCAQGGRLRLGYFDAGAFIERGPEARSNVFRGVDLRGGLACDGTNDEPVALGGTRPSLAVSDSRVGQAHAGVVAWIADSVDDATRDACGSGRSAEVQLLGLWLEADKAAAERRWVHASNDGEPVSLGTTTQGSPPALLHLDQVGTDSRFVVVLREAPTQRLVARIITVPKSPAYVGGDPSVARATPPVRIGDPLELSGTEGADATTLVLGPERDSVCGAAGREIGLTFRTGCGSASAQQRFASLGVTTQSKLCISKAAVSLGGFDDRRHVGPATATHLEDGFVREGFARSEHKADAGSTGGFVVSWTRGAATQPEVVATRVLDLDGQVLDTVSLARSADSPFFFDGPDGALRAAYRDAKASTLRVQSVSCAR